MLLRHQKQLMSCTQPPQLLWQLQQMGWYLVGGTNACVRLPTRNTDMEPLGLLEGGVPPEFIAAIDKAL
jgi:hypothetical protein